jgi:hypothetical protein
MSLTYNGRPKFTFKGIIQVIDTVMKKCVVVKENGSIIFRDREIVKTGLLGNSELVKYGYILDEKEKEERLQRFWDWYWNTTREDNESILKQIGTNTGEIFIELIHLEEEIDKPENRWNIRRFQRSIVYNTKIESRFGKPWVSGELTDKIRDEFKKTCGFTEIIEEVVISDPEEENNEESDSSEVSLNKELRGMGHEMERSEVEKLEKLDIEKEIILIDEFINKWWEVSNLSEKKMLEELEEWFIKNIVDCEKCNERRVKQYMYENEEKLIICKDCLIKGSKKKNDSKENTKNDSESDDESIDAEIDSRRIMIHKFEVKRLKRLGFNKYYLGSLTFIQEYKENEGKSNEKLIEILKEWKKLIEYNNSDTQENDEEIFIEEKEIIKNILEELEKLNIETNENEIIRLRSMGFNVIDILKEEFFKKFKKIKDELDNIVKSELEEWLLEEKV